MVQNNELANVFASEAHTPRTVLRSQEDGEVGFCHGDGCLDGRAEWLLATIAASHRESFVFGVPNVTFDNVGHARSAIHSLQGC
ncbi:hypothetical protein CEP54_008920 [Fusarium duplospermum]|uniref:Uncharacterized protein n=1 Tax=Fusarium duplospermum TaxID=1325734 RepID=A0A428PT76_9HYPO|nr:hypothetical protein CEP54_008920 [Fusarium duplospermum]